MDGGALMKRSVPLALALLLLLPVTLTSGFAGPPAADPLPLPAFPGAEGYGALARGGRGGRVIEVTNLNDSGPGSLRAAVNASGPRIVVFRVGGAIEVKSDIIIRGEDQAYLTIAGQTAPGGGILLKKYGLLLINTHDIVVRHIRVRPGWYGLPDPRGEGISETLGSFGYGRTGILVWGQAGGVAHDVIFDHVSVSWQTDDNAIWEGVRNVTVQWSAFAEGSRQGRDQYDCSGCGFLWGPKDQVQHLSFHHNLLIHEYYRSPGFGGGENQFINNVIYDPGWSASFLSQSTHTNYYGEAIPYRLDIIGNYYKKGPDTRAGSHEISFEIVYDPSVIQLHVEGNYGWSYDPNDPYAMVGGNVGYRRSAEPLVPAPSFPVTIHAYEDAKDLVISKVGATLPKRDAVDERLINEFNAGTGRLGIGSDFPTIANGTPPAAVDHDGMPDGLEVSHGLNPADAADGSPDDDGDGYTNVEEYLSELAGDTPTSFGDVPASHWAYPHIEALFQGGFLAGCSDAPRRFCPQDGLSRAEAAVFVERGIHGGGSPPQQPASPVFADVALDTWFAKWADALWQGGFTAGCAPVPPAFCPLQPHSRAEGAVFFLRMLRGADFVPPQPSSLFYSDVPLDAWFAKWVAAAYEAGLTRECEEPAQR